MTMKTITTLVILVALALVIGFIVSIAHGPRDRKSLRWATLTLPLLALLFFVGLFVEEGIQRTLIKKELQAATKEQPLTPERKETLKAKNERISKVIGNGKRRTENGKLPAGS